MTQSSQAIQDREDFSFSFFDGERRAFRPPERLTVSQWAERYRIVTEGPARGSWTNAKTPYLLEPMDLWTDPHVRELYLCFAPQSGKTSLVFNCLGYAIDQDPGPAMYVMPDEKVARRIARRRIIPFFEGTPRLRELMSSRKDDTATFSVKFKNGMDFMMAFAGSPASMASEAVRYMILDEIDKFPSFAGREADPMSLAEARTNTFTYNKKIVVISSPSEEPSPIYQAMRTRCDDVRVLYVTCPICGSEQRMLFENITWPESAEPRAVKHRHLAHYSCSACGFKWDDHLRDVAVSRSRWVSGILDADNAWREQQPAFRPVAVGFVLPSWYSPFVSLSDAAADYLWGEEHPKKKISFITQHRAEEYKEVVEKKSEAELLEKRTSLNAGIVPAGAVALTCGIDTQKNGFFFEVDAWIPTEKFGFDCYLVDYGFIAGSADMSALEDLLYNGRYPREDSPEEKMPIWRAAIDTGGGESGQEDTTRTEEIYDWLRSLPAGKVFGVKGSSHPMLNKIKTTTIDKMPHSSKPIPRGLELRIIDTGTFKTILHNRLSRTEGEPRRFFLHADVGLDYVRQLTAEELRSDKRGRQRWFRVRSANHYLDCHVYAEACADAEWQPSLRILAARLKAQQSGDPRAQEKFRRVRSKGLEF